MYDYFFEFFISEIILFNNVVMFEILIVVVECEILKLMMMDFFLGFF